MNQLKLIQGTVHILKVVTYSSEISIRVLKSHSRKKNNFYFQVKFISNDFHYSIRIQNKKIDLLNLKIIIHLASQAKILRIY